jgi:hypothetical protein
MPRNYCVEGIASSSIDEAQRRGHYLHLRTQRDQPYGSERRCCEVCGTMVWPARQGNSTPWWTDDPASYDVAPNKCSLRPRE